ncbi:uncharacterized protein C5orf49 homolog [Pollicipes pollicipes]|nr:uncharacterized protein C5orf49 homolog [Pollicipes pollicipes]
MDPAITYFGPSKKEHNVICQYDQVYRQKSTWNQKLHREDGQYKLAAVNMWREEAERTVPVLGSSLYGHRTPIDTIKTTRSQRIHTVEQEFLRPRNVFPGCDP